MKRTQIGFLSKCLKMVLAPFIESMGVRYMKTTTEKLIRSGAGGLDAIDNNRKGNVEPGKRNRGVTGTLKSQVLARCTGTQGPPAVKITRTR